MFTVIPQPVKIIPFDVYNFIHSQIICIKNISSFSNYSIISPSDLISISNIIFDCVEKLSDTSALYIKKLNDSNISSKNINNLHEMYCLHNELLERLYKFNTISSDISEKSKEIFDINSNKDVINYIYYDIINRSKLIIFQIIESIKKLSIYSELFN